MDISHCTEADQRFVPESWRSPQSIRFRARAGCLALIELCCVWALMPRHGSFKPEIEAVYQCQRPMNATRWRKNRHAHTGRRRPGTHQHTTHPRSGREGDKSARPSRTGANVYSISAASQVLYLQHARASFVTDCQMPNAHQKSQVDAGSLSALWTSKFQIMVINNASPLTLPEVHFL